MNLKAARDLKNRQSCNTARLRIKMREYRNILDDLEYKLSAWALEYIEQQIVNYWDWICRELGTCPYCSVQGMDCPHCGGTDVNREILRQTA